MSEQREDKEEEVKGEEEENTATNPHAGESTPEQPPEEDREPGLDGEEEHTDRQNTGANMEAREDAEPQLDLHTDPDQQSEPQKEEDVDLSIVTDVLEEADTQVDLPVDAEQLREPQRMENIGNSTATVKVVLVPEGHVMTVAFAIGLSITDLKGHLASELRVPAEVLQISLDGRVVEEQQSLMELGVRPHGSTRMEMSSIDPKAHPLRPVRPPEHDNMPDVITVRVHKDESVFEEVVVEIERPRQQKVFLGGYKNRLTGVEFHHAAIQTLPKRRPDRGVVVFSRDTQTAELKSQVQQCAVDASTQMTGIGCYVSCMNDKLVTPGNYITADEYHDRRLKAVILLQSYARRWLAQQEVSRLYRDRDRRLAWLELRERKRKEEKEEQLRDRHHRRMNPQRREDFNLLFHALEKWRIEEEQNINSSLRGAERKAALCSLLEQETQLISAIGQHRIAAQNINYDKAVKSFLDKSAAPHQWRGADGRVIEMDTPHTIRARELKELYNNTNMRTVSKEERLQTLMTVKHTVKEHECQLTRDIVDLIDREADLMARKVKVKNLEGLRQRISTLLLQYIKTPEFNPEAARLLKVPQNPSVLKNNMLLCRSCNRYLQSDKFTPTAGGRLRDRCRSCSGLENIARSRNDLWCYKNILKRLRADELRINKEAKIPFLLQVEDVKYLVDVIWASCSALHGSTDLYSLVFVRWEHHRDWSPWNCILLSKEETSAHLEVEDVHKAYATPFIHRIERKHMLARRHFSQIATMTAYLDSPPAAALGNQLVSMPITMATGKHTSDSTPSSAH
ncbi:IQ and ubiquitin-like domain-containing protein [Cheilinus undulatus]|uniref:IQ and ubiquitin-like domain-containing protein n=1 Tax=Cheilinus undulatus TaxID=241271 RepID=UPI001BD511CA|nr:IQ and ubiquitin-like domain-containing protein [Cheilinus undulatus]